MTNEPTPHAELAEAAREFSSELHRAALSYFQAAMPIFHKERVDGYPNRQVAVGMLGISVELFLKSYVAGQHITLAFKGLPQELTAAFLVPEQA